MTAAVFVINEGNVLPFPFNRCVIFVRHIVFSQMRAVAVRDIANQLSLSRIAPTTSFVRRHNLFFCAATPKCAPLVAIFQITMNESFDRPRPDGVGFLT